MARTKRLDVYLLENGLFGSREAARTAIMDGSVIVGGVKVTKPGAPVKDGTKVEVLPSALPRKFVSRGGIKLQKALDEFRVSVVDRVCLDVGASTGGFTDCLLQRGARLVFAVDVGYGQLDWKLRQDPRVEVRERLNARTLTQEAVYGTDPSPDRASLAVIDISFISLVKVIPAVTACLADGFEIIALIKPQFEAGPALVGKGGVVRDAEVHRQVLDKVLDDICRLGLRFAALTFSPLKGPNGNIEFLCHFRSGDASQSSPALLFPGPGGRGDLDETERSVSAAPLETQAPGTAVTPRPDGLRPLIPAAGSGAVATGFEIAEVVKAAHSALSSQKDRPD